MQRTRRWLPILAILLGAAPAAAKQSGEPVRPAPAAHALELRNAAAADSLRGVRLGLTTLPFPVPVELRVEAPAFFAPAAFDAWLASWTAATRARLAAAHASPRSAVGGYPAEGASAGAGEAGTGRTAARGRAQVDGDSATGPNLLPQSLAQYADLSVRVVGRGELGGSWTRHDPCDPSLYYSCQRSLFPQLRPDVQLGVLVGGTISDRVHVDVDYDQDREFDAANNIRVYYQGRDGEFVRRVEVGDVSFRLPHSRFLTQGVPAGNFGFMASGQRGPLELHAVYAQQKGDVTAGEFRLGGGAQQGFVQEQRVVLDDADYAAGQFFLLVHPDSLTGTPHVDALALRASDAPAAVRPRRGGTIRLYRDERLSTLNPQQRAQLGYFLADAYADDGATRHSGLFRRLEQEQDYVVHASGLWVALRSPLRPDEALAVTYVSEAGDEIGDVNAEGAPAGATPRLRLLRAPATQHQPGAPTWPYELRNIYRVDAGIGVDPASVTLTISLGEASAGRTFRQHEGRQITFLRLFGLDEESPVDALDGAQLWQPGRDVFGEPAAAGGMPGTFLVFPTLRPFAQPPPSPAAALSAAQAAALLGADTNAAIYDEPDPVARAGAGRFRLGFDYRVRVEGLVSTFSLGALGVREGSDRLRIGDREMVRGQDYEIDYDIGTITLMDAPSLFARHPGAEIHAQWEQKSMFQIAPTSIFGLNARYDLGTRGELNMVGLYQSERQLMMRPQLGTEPGAMLIGGVSGRVALGTSWLDRALQALPFVRSNGESSAVVSGEIALSSPDPNRRGDTYLDDFDTGDELTLSVRRHDWRLGSRPQSTDGAAGALPLALDVANAASLVWQHDVLVDGVVAGTVLPQRDLDRQISVAGAPLPEPAMWLSFGGDGRDTGDLAWRSITTVLSQTGRDMTRSEYVEFYVRADHDRPLALVFDIGTVGEDAFYFDAHGNTSGVYPDGTRWGLGVLDEEASLADRELWGTDRDARGLWDQPCMAEPLTAYALGDARANCTRGNGVPDSEDLDGNGVLDAEDGAYFRYVVELDRLSPYLVRDTAATGTRYRLYRIPLRGAGSAMNGASENSWRFVRHMRITVAGDAPAAQPAVLTLARLRIVGARWTKRDVHGVQRGLVSDASGGGAGMTRVRVGPVSRVTEGALYSPPPGVHEQLQDPTDRFGVGGVEFNEKSLRIAYDDLLPDERAEVFFRYPQQPRSFLSYRQLRLWAVAREGRWGGDGEELVVRLGTDARNFYLYRTPLQPATGPRPVADADWLPELVIDFDPWLELKARAERRMIEHGGGGLEPDTLWSEDGRYAIVFEDRARAPNLAAIRELAFAVYNGGVATTSGEVWLDELRLGAAFREPGTARHVSIELRGGDVFDVALSYGGRGAVFQQLNQHASYLGSDELNVSAGIRLDRMMPESWGLAMPLSVSHVRTAQTPTFLERSDVRADMLDGLRSSGSDATRVSLTLRREAPSANPLIGALVDGAALRFGYTALNANTVTSRSQAAGMDVGVTYRYDPARRDVGAMPRFLADALRAVAPAALEESDAFQRMLGARFRYTPAGLSFGTSWFRNENRAWRYERILSLDSDTLIAPVESPRLGMEQDARVSIAPFEALTAEVSVRSSRDLLEPERAATGEYEQDALRGARDRVAGMDLGWETNRNMTTNVAFRPRITPWLRPNYTFGTRFSTDRHASYIALLTAGEDTTALLQRRFIADRTISRGVQLEPAGLFAALAGSGDTGALPGRARRAAGALLPLSVQWTSRVGSSFERETFAPSLGYQLGLGGFDGFRVIGEDTAANARERGELRVGSGVRLPLGAQVDVNFFRAEQDVYDAVGGTRSVDERGWPNVRLAWMRLPLPGWAAGLVRTASLSTGFERTTRSSAMDSFTRQERGSDETRVPLLVSMALANGLVTSYNVVWTDGTSTDPTGQGEQHARMQSFQLGGALTPPGSMRGRLENPINAMLSYTKHDQTQCRIGSGAQAGECVAYVDLETSNVNFTVDTLLSDLRVGMQMSYTGRHNGIGTVAGSSRFQLSLFGQFSFEAGRLPATPAGGIR